MGAADADEACVRKFLVHCLVVPHPKVSTVSDPTEDNSAQSSTASFMPKAGFAHKAVRSLVARIIDVSASKKFEVGNHQSKDAAGSQDPKRVAKGDPKILQRQVLEYVRTVHGCAGAGSNRQSRDNVSNFHILGKSPVIAAVEATQQRNPFKSQSRGDVEISPPIRSGISAPKMYILDARNGLFFHTTGLCLESRTAGVYPLDLTENRLPGGSHLAAHFGRQNGAKDSPFPCWVTLSCQVEKNFHRDRDDSSPACWLVTWCNRGVAISTGKIVFSPMRCGAGPLDLSLQKKLLLWE